MKTKTTLTGIDDVSSLLANIAPKEALNLTRSTVHATAGQVAKDAKRFMPADTGTMKAATKTRRRKVRNGTVRSDVMVGKGAFYWRFREYGQGPDLREDAMFMKAIAQIRGQIDRIFTEQFGKKLEARLRRLGNAK